ncbi:CHASE domain-containing protein [Janthinobacterium fluminis]|uniref:histidine kinase n=1 Tax=Janthinobacterium fluminis TaxID=2987524 RepID=A0ABT5K1V0_9BURK|nr:CHASE domain-containing protein [Janthinobacterium fluminis]MDC8758964.1 CHASE domain-containing protein [Janthinobacterium fluminis]
MDVQDRQISANFQRDSEKIAHDTRLRLQTYFDVLLSVKAMHAVGDGVGRAQLARFIGELKLTQRYPGFQAIQFVRRVPGAGLDAYAAAVRADASISPGGYPRFKVHPAVARDEHFVIDFSEPMQGNENAFGLDLAALPLHARALEMGRDSGAIIATERIALVQDASGEPGFVARAPVYRSGLPLDTVAQRQAALSGFVAIVFRVNNLMREVVDAKMLPHMALRIHDGGYAGDGAGRVLLMYDSANQPGGGAGGAALPQLRARASVNVGQRQWQLTFSAYDGSRYGRNRAVIAVIGGAGAIISALIAALMLTSQRRRALADTLSATLHEQRAFQDSAIVGIGLFSGGFILRCNRGLEEMMGYRPGELNGLPTSALLPRAALAQADPFDCDADGQGRRGELQLVCKVGTPLWCMINGKALDPDNPAKGCIWVIHDVSDRKRAEAALLDARDGLQHSVAELEQQTANVEAARDDLAAVLATLKQAQNNLITSEKMASLGSLVAGIAHELNTPIGNSLLTATALQDIVCDFERQFVDGAVKRSALLAYLADTKQACAIMAGSLARAADLITSFKQVAVDQTSDQRRSFDLDEVLRDTLATYAAQLRRANCEVRVDVPRRLRFESYPGSVGQVLSNLINNTLLHAFEGRASGVITIRATAAENGQVRLLFADDGVGMAPKTLHQVFDPFFTTKMGQGGSGLGMNIVYNIVTGMLKGRIEIQSEAGRGTSVTLTLPTTAPEHSQESADELLGTDHDFRGIFPENRGLSPAVRCPA